MVDEEGKDGDGVFKSLVTSGFWRYAPGAERE
jgi:hypothetical protein